MTRPILPSDGTRPDAVRPDAVRPDRSAAGGSPVEEVQAVRPVDRIEISEQGRALAEEAGLDVPRPYSPSVKEVLQRIREGFYDSPAVAEATARNLLASGDL